MRRVLTTAAALALATGTAAAADAQAGRAIAERWCAACHVVSPDQTTATDEVPSLMRIGGRADMTAERLATILSGPHPPMPDMTLTRREIDHLVAYIESVSE